MTAAKVLRAISAVSILWKGQNPGTISNSVGVFFHRAFKKEIPQFFPLRVLRKKEYKEACQTLLGTAISVIQLLQKTHAFYLSKQYQPYPSKKKFEKAFFVSMDNSKYI